MIGCATGRVALAAPGAASRPPFERCAARVRLAPDDIESYRCYLSVARSGGLHAEAMRWLEALAARPRPSPKALLCLGALEQDLGGRRVETLYRSTVALAASSGDAASEVRARAALGGVLGYQGRLQESATEIERALAGAMAASDPFLRAEVWLLAADQANVRADHGQARELLSRAEAVVFPAGPPELQSRTLSGLGYLSWAQGDHLGARAFYRRQLEALLRAGNHFVAASARYNIALVVAAGRLAPREEIRALEDEALAAALRAGNDEVAAKVHASIGQALPPRQAITHYRRSMELAVESGTRLFAMRQLGWAMQGLGPEQRAQGLRWIDRAQEDARALGSRFHFARACVLKAGLASRQASREGLIREYQRAFAAIEAIRDLQPEGLLRSRVFGQWAFVYYRFAGALLGGLARSSERERDLEQAFLASERLRARSLLDRLDAAGVSVDSGAVATLHQDRERVLDGIAAVQRELMSLGLPAGRRQQALSGLERLEREEGALRARLARLDARFARLRTPAIPTPAQLQRALQPDEALLAYQLWYRFDQEDRWEPGGSWLYAITRSATRVYPMPTRDALDAQVDVFVGLFERRDGSEAGPAAALYRRLLEPALRELPASVKRLVIVPDGALHRLPFAALRSSAGAPPLATTHQISYAPSATLWMRWRADAGAVPVPRALALADPILRDGAPRAVLRAADPWLEGLRAGRLPFARREARALVRALGGGIVREGREASEARLKRSELRSFGSLVFAAHAVVDDEKPERSAVLLAPGDGQQDGLLQFREIADLDLRDQVVILSACRTAVGADLVGEGIMGLAHAFFQAGARAVVASLWILRDREQQRLAERLASELAAGRGLSAALAGAQRSLIRDGVPAAAWAGLIVLGDGERVPRPREGAGSPWRRLAGFFWPGVLGGRQTAAGAPSTSPAP